MAQNLEVQDPEEEEVEYMEILRSSKEEVVLIAIIEIERSY